MTMTHVPSTTFPSPGRVPLGPRPPVVRAVRGADREGLYEVCLRTGWHGGDASAHCQDRTLLGDIFAGPYVTLEPGLVFVAEDGLGVVGHVVGAADTPAFASRTESAWWPVLRRRHPLPDPADERPAACLVRALHQGVPTDMPFVHRYPAHLHMGLLPRGQRRGLGTALMQRLLSALQARGAPGVHLGVSALNPGAIAFYEAQGFETLEAHEWGRWMGLRL